jgi:chromosomal replication initiator protein
LGRISADGADVVDCLNEIPLPGRILAAPNKNSAAQPVRGALSSFVAGPENRLVAATFERLVNAPSPGVATHIVALFGPTGVGKTHLASGLIRNWQAKFGDDAAHYTTAADFRRHLIESIDTNSVSEFRNACRTRRLLAIDDLHRLPSDDYLLHELRYTLDAYEENGGLVVVTSHRPPETLANLSSDLRSRFAAGLSLQLATPSTDARLQIIRQASLAADRFVSEESAHRIAENIHGSAADVLSALFELWSAPARSSVSETAQTERLLTARKTRQPSLPEILAAVARYTKVPQKLLKSGSRKQSIVSARAIVVYLARELADARYEQIGRILGGRDHSTIMHNYKKIQRELNHDATTQEAVADLKRLLQRR